MKVLEVPSAVMCNIEVGRLFKYLPTGRIYKLVYRDAVRCYIKPWTWWDDFKVFLGEQYYGWRNKYTKSNN